jgi:acetyl-CoA carboxylase biotin carboxyl carrier protein
MNLKEIKELINLMNENELTELEIEREGTKIRLRKSSAGRFEAVTEEPGAGRSTEIVRPDSAAAKAESAAPSKNLTAIKAPMVGTFYRAPSPDSKPYIEIGQQVEAGQVVCVIEAMKLMNEIKSEVKGKVAEIMAENSTPVEYGQALFMVEPV